MSDKYTNVDELINRLPEGYEQLCRDTKALKRSREIKTPQDLIKLVFLYLTGGYSLLEICVLAQELGLGQFSDTAFMKKFGKCRQWLEQIIEKIKPSAIISYAKPSALAMYTLITLDASDVTEKGKSKRVFRLHYAFDLMTMSSVAYTITSEKVGESLKNFKLLDNWLVIADRAYGTKTGIVCCLDQKANFILRIKHGAFIIYNEQGEEIDLLTQLTDVDDTSALDLDVWVKLPKIGMTKMRICAMKIPEDKIAQIEHKDVRKASKRQHKVSKEALELHKYVIVITSLHKDITAEEILATYRLRWQVELYFKRLKSIMDFGNVPLKREENIFAWLNGKFLIALLLEKMLSEIVFPPPE